MRFSKRHALRALCFTAVGLAACSSDDRPSGVIDNGDGAIVIPESGMMTLDLGSAPDTGANPDTGAGMDGGTTPTDVTVLPDGMVVDTGPAADNGQPTDVPGDAARDGAADAPDARVVMRCGMTAAQRAALAVRIATCTRQPPQTVLARFFSPDAWEGGPLAQRNCAALSCARTAMTCSNIMSNCLKYTASEVAGGTCPSPTNGCAASRFATSCANGVNISDDCEATGQRCVASSTEARCVPMPSMTDACSDGAPPRCVGNRLQRCVIGVYANVADCSQTNTVCDATADACTDPSGPACTDAAPSCSGTSLRVCRGGHLVSLDCGLINTDTSCRTRGSSFCGTGTECDPAAAPANGTCEGNTLALCAGGQPFRFDCVAAGFTSCGSLGCAP